MTHKKTRLAAMACLLTALLGACTGKGPIRDVERTIADRYGTEIQVVSMRALRPSAPLARWNGVYGIYLQDRADAEQFMVRLGPDEALATLTTRIDAARQEKDQHVARQKAALAQLQALGLQGDAFSLQAASVYGSVRWNVAVFADMDALRQDGAMLDDAAWQVLGRIVHAGLAPEPSISVIPAAHRAQYRAVLDKGYHGRIEFIGGEPATVMQSLEDGADAWWTVDAAALPAPYIVTERQADLREACYAAIAALRARNHFKTRHGIYVQPRRNVLQAYRIADRLRDAGLRQGHTAYAVLDRADGRMVLRGIVAEDAPHGPDAYAVEGVYEYEFAIATGTLQVRRLPG
ncbi:hypothetical protein [Achromobacter spanius]|uniref:hypothetical protein n=1 Tax=Achromobacter spanius TaxID=217203 RepID=UPI00380D55D9